MRYVDSDVVNQVMEASKILFDSIDEKKMLSIQAIKGEDAFRVVLVILQSSETINRIQSDCTLTPEQKAFLLHNEELRFVFKDNEIGQVEWRGTDYWS